MVSLLLAIIYIAFISLGLPDALLGAAWPIIHQEFGVDVSLAGGISVIIAAGTVISSLLSDRMTRRFGPGAVTAFSVALTAGALFGFSVSNAYWQLCLWAVPYGLGAGSVDASLNNYVALHYASRHMSWLHCMWGLGASAGPYILGAALSGGMGWHTGYGMIALFQMLLTAALLLSLPLWKKMGSESGEHSPNQGKPLSLRDVLHIQGTKEILLAFFCYCAAEQTAMLWGSSYLVMRDGVPEETAASLGSLFLIGITAGRAASGFLTYKLNDTNMIRLGQAVMAAGIGIMLLPLGKVASMVGLLLFGLGCAPVYPSIIHSTPAHFGEENSQAIVGIQMASAYVGTCLMPPLFGILTSFISVGWLPVYLVAIVALMVGMCEQLNKKCPI